MRILLSAEFSSSAGRSRSVCIVAAYFVVHENMTENEALSLIQSKREIYLSDGIDEIFKLCKVSF